MTKLRVLLHDYTGHPFPLQLARELANRGYQVQHIYSASFQTPHGVLTHQPTDPANFAIKGIHLKEPLQKQSFIKRRFQEVEYGKLLAAEIKAFVPDIIISSNTPTEAQAQAVKASKALNAKFIYWVQDIYSVAAHRILRKKIPILGELIGQYYMALERRLLRASAQVVLITEDFRQVTNRWGISTHKTHVIPNWAPIQEVPVRPKDNPWARAHQVADKFCILYSGTLGMKHNPELLLQLAINFKNDPEIQVIVISEGQGAEWLNQKKIELKLTNLEILGFQPYEELPDVLGSADILTAILEPDAGVFSVPSKVLTYLCSKRPLLLAVPTENLAARIVAENNAGLVVPPTDIVAYIQSAKSLRSQVENRTIFAKNARTYAEKYFNIQVITSQFEKIMHMDSANLANSDNLYIGKEDILSSIAVDN